ncbi:MAG TPA: DUF2169 domain-containing protein [Candidatus Nanopelagicales bacterium]|nr:DUF2169 domain-containing protein [Candidatus Nanopelagicales bacterium]
MQPPFRLPAEDPSKVSQILEGLAPNGEPIVSVVFGRSFSISPGGALSPRDDFEIVKELRYEKARVTTQFTRPSLLVRDTDLYPWRNLTDVVVRGTARSDRPVEQLEVALRVTGEKARIAIDLVVTGDRRVEQGPSGLRLTAPERFTEMPLTYDRAYGGTDELAEAEDGGVEVLNFLADRIDPEEAAEISVYSYPRNPAGRGYLVREEGTLGTLWPNVELKKDRLKLAELVQPLAQWGERPYPAGFDWFPHAWFPRCAFFVDYPPTHDGKVPRAERELGLFPPDFDALPILKRPKHAFMNGAHPMLCRDRLVGDEAIRVGHMGPGGQDLELTLPGLAPRVSIRLCEQPALEVPASLDLVLVEADLARVTLLFRATMFRKRERLPMYWVEQSEYRIAW